MSRKRRRNRNMDGRKAVYVVKETGNEVHYGDCFVIRERKRTPLGMQSILTNVEVTPVTLPKLIEQGIVVKKREEKAWKPSVPLLSVLLKIQEDVRKTGANLFGFLTALSVIKADMYGTSTNKPDHIYGVNLHGVKGRFANATPDGWALFKSKEDLESALNVIPVMYQKAFAKCKHE